MKTKAPIIGLCAAFEQAKWSFWDMQAAIIAETYLNHLKMEGAVPLAIIPSEITAENAEQLVKSVDGLLLLGGSDVDPSFYGQEPIPELESTAPLRDKSEIALVRAAMRLGTPLLGICRGLQIMNVATGGTLHQDIGKLGPERHRKSPGKLDESTFHEVQIYESTHLAEAMNAGELTVNSHHHQAIDRLGEGGRVSAISTQDSIVEAVEWGEGFALGVQWHPETAEPGGVITYFVNQSKNFKSGKD